MPSEALQLSELRTFPGAQAAVDQLPRKLKAAINRALDAAATSETLERSIAQVEAALGRSEAAGRETQVRRYSTALEILRVIQDRKGFREPQNDTDAIPAFLLDRRYRLVEKSALADAPPYTVITEFIGSDGTVLVEIMFEGRSQDYVDPRNPWSFMEVMMLQIHLKIPELEDYFSTCPMVHYNVPDAVAVVQQALKKWAADGPPPPASQETQTDHRLTVDVQGWGEIMGLKAGSQVATFTRRGEQYTVRIGNNRSGTGRYRQRYVWLELSGDHGTSERICVREDRNRAELRADLLRAFRLDR